MSDCIYEYIRMSKYPLEMFPKTNRVVINPFYGIYKTLNDKIRIKDILPHGPKYGSRRGKVYEPQKHKPACASA